MNRGNKIETVLTGACLGVMQVVLSISVMSGTGGAATTFFFFLLCWLLGSGAGTWFERLSGRHLSIALLFGAAVASVLAVVFLDNKPFDSNAGTLGFLAAFLCGLYGGVFYRDRTARWKEVRLVLLYENNGFIIGYIAAALGLFTFMNWVRLLALFLAVIVVLCILADNKKQTDSITASLL